MEAVTLHCNGELNSRHFQLVLVVIEHGRTYPNVQIEDTSIAGQKTISNPYYMAEQIILITFNHFVTSVIFKKMLATALLSMQNIRFFRL